MSENRLKTVRHYSVRKRESREFHGSGRISNHVNFARDVEVLTIATTKDREEYNGESKIESQTLHYGMWMCFPSNSSSSFEIKSKVFLAKS